MVNFSNFQQLDPQARDVAMGLLADANSHQPSFTSFTYRWMAFNGWMSAVTLEHRDWAMINSIADDPRLVAQHDQLMAEDAGYRQLVSAFAAMWPVLKVSDARTKFGYDVFRHMDRTALLETNVKRQPVDWEPGSMLGWEQVLRTIYQVRCNLFHGEKSQQNHRDLELVVLSDGIMRTFIERSSCFDWYNE